MSEEALKALREKRAELISQVQEMHSEIFHIDHAIRLLGGRGPKRRNQMFGPGELIKLIGEAERLHGLSGPKKTALHIIRAKGLDATDKDLIRRVRWSVTECRKRMAGRGV
jgi:hypothetical protein